MKNLIIALFSVFGSVQALAETITVELTVPTCYQSSTDALESALKMAKKEASQQCPNSNWFNPWLTGLQVAIGKTGSNACGGVSIVAEYSCTRQ